MKDLVFLLVTLGLITFAMMFAQGRYYDREAEVNRQWKKDRHMTRPSSPTPSPTPTASVVP